MLGFASPQGEGHPAVAGIADNGVAFTFCMCPTGCPETEELNRKLMLKYARRLWKTDQEIEAGIRECQDYAGKLKAYLKDHPEELLCPPGQLS